MTGSHEVRGSIPLGSTNIRNDLGHPLWMPFVVLCAYSVPDALVALSDPLSFVVNQKQYVCWLLPEGLEVRVC